MTADIQDMGVNSGALDATVPKFAKAVSKVPAGQQLHDMVRPGQSALCLSVCDSEYLSKSMCLASDECVSVSFCMHVCALACVQCKYAPALDNPG